MWSLIFDTCSAHVSERNDLKPLGRLSVAIIQSKAMDEHKPILIQMARCNPEGKD